MREELWIVFDLRYPDMEGRLHCYLEACLGYGDVDELDEDHRVLVLRPGGALMLLRRA
jgi:hypothetical protein